MNLTEFSMLNEFDVTCQRTVPVATVAFFRSSSFQDAVRNAVSLGGDADKLACIAGAMAAAYYGGVPAHIQEKVFRCPDDGLREEVVASTLFFGYSTSSGMKE